jgi:predicted transposase YbfD/YdcC
MQWHDVKQQLTTLIEHEEIIKLAALCCQIGDAFIQHLVIKTLFGTQTSQQLEQIETQLTEDITSALSHQNSEKKQAHEQDRNHRLHPLRRTLTFHGSPHYVNAMMARHEQQCWLAQMHRTTSQAAEEQPISQSKHRMH